MSFATSSNSPTIPLPSEAVGISEMQGLLAEVARLHVFLNFGDLGNIFVLSVKNKTGTVHDYFLLVYHYENLY